VGWDRIWRSQGAGFWGPGVLLVANLMLEIAVSIRNLLRVRYALDWRLLCLRRLSRYLRQFLFRTEVASTPVSWCASRVRRIGGHPTLLTLADSKWMLALWMPCAEPSSLLRGLIRLNAGLAF